MAAPPPEPGDGGPRIVGFIRPPPDIRAVVDKTAAFVARNGREFESKILADKGGDAKFAFLRPDNPYHGYYRHKVEEAHAPPPPPPVEPAAGDEAEAAAASSSSGAGAGDAAAGEAPQHDGEAAAQNSGVDASSAAVPSSSSSSSASSAPRSSSAPPRRPDVLPNPLSRALKAVDLSSPPPPNEFAVVVPTYAPPAQVEAIKLTAQYTAVSGRGFLAALAAREGGNPSFDFLRPTHSLFPFFTACVDAYGRALRPRVTVLERLARDSGVGGRGGILHRVVARYAHAQAEEESRAARESAAANERSVQASIDWHDAVLVETVPFPEDDPDELADLPPPMPHPAALLAARGAGVKQGAGGAVVPRAVVQPSKDTAATLASVVEGARASAAAASSMASSASSGLSYLAKPRPPASAASSSSSSSASSSSSTASDAGRTGAVALAQLQQEVEEEEEPLRVVTDYIPSLSSSSVGSGAASAPTAYFDPRTGASIPIEAAGHHLRIETLDPSWGEQQARYRARQSTTLLAGGDEVADNLRRLAASRSDVFAPDRGAGGGGGVEGREEPPAKRAKQG